MRKSYESNIRLARDALWEAIGLILEQHALTVDISRDKHEENAQCRGGELGLFRRTHRGHR